MIVGLGIRRFHIGLPPVIVKGVPDTLWALCVYWLLALVSPGVHPGRRGVLAGVIAAVVEFSQLYHSPWLDVFRRTLIGALTIGSGFQATDLLWYTAGIACGVLIAWRRLDR